MDSRVIPAENRHKLVSGWLLVLGVLLLSCQSGVSREPGPTGVVPSIQVPLGGNAFVTRAEPDATEVITDQGLSHWTRPGTVTSIYFRLSQGGALRCALAGNLNGSASSTVQVSINGQPFTVNLNGSGTRSFEVGTVAIPGPGYVRVDLQGIRKNGPSFGEISALELSGPAAATQVLCAKDAENFYWSRRGPSVHLAYEVPADTEYFYSEVTVPVGQDAVGSYVMANGFAEGYCGIQVNSPTERRVLFSVWDPPSGGPTALVRKGPGVVDNSFGGEGTGGQSYLAFNWVAGRTYGFLTRATPDQANATNYSAWFFAPEVGAWRFLATWKRPNTNTYLVRCHSFLENFLDFNGFLGRRACFGNQWARSAAGAWTELTQGRFTGDDTARKQQRMDFAGGLEGGQFYLRNGGFFDDYVALNQTYRRPATGRSPEVDVAQLP